MANKLRFWTILIVLLVLSACSGRVDEPQGSPSGRASNALTTPATLRGFSIGIPQRDQTQAKEPVASLLAILSGEPIEPLDVAADSTSATKHIFGVKKLPTIRAEWDSSTDTFNAIDVELARVRDGVEVSESEARGRASAALQSMVAHGVIAPDAFSMSDADVHRVVQGVGSSAGEAPVESTKEFRFFLPRRIDGIVVNDGGHLDLGMRILVHRSGVVRGIKISGLGLSATVAAGSEGQPIDSSVFDRRVTAEFPDSTITPLGLRYSLGSDGEPRQVYRVSRNVMVDGALVHSRAKLVYYSTKDGSTAPQIWPTPNPGDSSMQPKPEKP
jgi:hypothetical protein